MLATALHGRRILLPIKYLTRIRPYFKDSMMSKHYYSLSKYMGAYMAMSYCHSAPVILERYWHDQATFIMAKTFIKLIPENSTVYEFPRDLLIPDMMFFVNGALDQGIHNETTVALHTHNELSAKIVELYRRMRYPQLIEIAPPGLPKPMLMKILEKVEKIKHKFLPRPLYKPKWHS